MTHLYCVGRADAPRPEGEPVGIGGAPTRTIEVDGLVAWVSEGGESATVEALREHERVVREILRHATPVPFRFGTRVASDEDVRTLLSERGAELRELLERVEGAVEMTLRVTEPGREEAPPAGPGGVEGEGGRAYLERRRAALERRREEEDRVMEILHGADRAVGEWTIDRRFDVRPRGESLGSVAHLVHADSVRSYLDRVRDLQQQSPELRFVASGPWAPYSFV